MTPYRGYRLLHWASRTSARSTTSLLLTMCLQRRQTSPSMKDPSTSWATVAATPFNWTSRRMDGTSTRSAPAVEVILNSSTDCNAQPAMFVYIRTSYLQKKLYSFPSCHARTIGQSASLADADLFTIAPSRSMSKRPSTELGARGPDMPSLCPCK